MTPIKISIELDSDRWHGVSVESLWAEDTGNETAQLDNVPLFAVGVSHRDVVRYSTIVVEGALLNVFKAVVQASGNSTYRIRVEPEYSATLEEQLINRLKEKGCVAERGRHHGYELFAISIPAEADADEIYALMEAIEKQGLAEIEEGNDVHPAARDE